MHMLRNGTARSAVLLPALILGLDFGPPGTAAAVEHWPADAYVLRIDGLACPYCGYGIEKQFQKQEGVQGTEIDIDEGVVIVSVDSATRFSDDELKQLVHDAGFELGGVVQRPQGG